MLILGPVFGPGDYAKLLTYQSAAWVTAWGNNGNGNIGFWSMTTADVYLAGNFDASSNQDEVLCLKPVVSSACAKLISFDKNNLQWWTLWSNGCDGTIESLWNLGPDQKYVVGDFDGIEGDELLVIGGVYAKLLKYSAGSWSQLWGNGGDGKIFNGLLMDSVDQYVAGNFNTTNGADELMVLTEAYGVFGLSVSATWNGNATGNLAWTGSGAGSLSSIWSIDENDRYFVGGVVPGAGDELLAVAPGGSLAHLFTNSGSAFHLHCSSASAGFPWNVVYPTGYVVVDAIAGNGSSELVYVRPGGLYIKDVEEPIIFFEES